MFETSLVESSGALRSRSSRYVWLTATFNAALVAGMIVTPLLHPEALPRTLLSSMLLPPVPPPSVSHPTVAVARVANVVARLDPFMAPASVPHHVDSGHDDAPPLSLGTQVTTMSAMGEPGPVGAIGLGAAPLTVRVAPPRAVAPAHVSSGVIAGTKLSGSSPLYPAIARAAHVSGAVVLRAVISRAGTIQSLTVISGPEMLRANAVAAVQDWRYRPYLLNGEPTEVDTTITVNFLFGG